MRGSYHACEPETFSQKEYLNIYYADRDLHLAAHSDVIVCDATFKTSPNNASQVLGLQVRMFNKDNESEFICKTIKEAWIRVESDIDKPKFRVDFESANQCYFLHIWPRKSLRMNRTFMIDFELQMAALALNITIYVYSPNHRTKWLPYFSETAQTIRIRQPPPYPDRRT
ncbi:hypothetical protein L596_019011 [Steinernema carpocapsae]|uniref:Uncharacterized protein n=1 Tax=Steinernema carpocapsae TaxID=34508 RepID=A0A4U5N6C3_STECR|nr:hypothetical protein L596_019011 [Steinernema carpocapsae]